MSEKKEVRFLSNGTVVLPDGSGFFVAEVRTRGIRYQMERLKRKFLKVFGKKCTSCGYRGAIKWNPYNKVTSCHNCGAQH